MSQVENYERATAAARDNNNSKKKKRQKTPPITRVTQQTLQLPENVSDNTYADLRSPGKSK